MDTLLAALGAKTRIRDPIYGFIRLTPAEMKIVDSPLFQRLRRVHQLALTKFVYPSAEHSRFVHSLGVVHAATAMFAAVSNNSEQTTATSDSKLTYAKILRFAALLHDIGHIPFSHAAEEVWLTGFDHEEISCHIINNYPGVNNVIEQEDVNPKTVASLLTKQFQPRHRLLHEIISGQLDADRADYLLRDSHCCGVKYGEYDSERYLSMFRATGEANSFRLVIDERDLYVAESFLIARYHYNMQVPYHRTRMGYDIALEMFIKEMDFSNSWYRVDDNGKLAGMDFDEFENLDDNLMFERFKAKARENDFWGKCLLRREHLRLVLDEPNGHTQGEQIYKNYVAALLGAGFKEDIDFFKRNRKVDILKGLRMAEDEDPTRGAKYGANGDPNSILVRKRKSDGGGTIDEDIRNVSWIFSKLIGSPPMIYRVYVIPTKYDEAVRVRAAVYREMGHGSKD